MFKRIFILFVLAAGIIGCFGIYLLYNHFTETLKENKLNEASASTQKSFIYFSRLDGTGVEKKEEETPRVVGLMIDNHNVARPQTGLAEARVVYEAMAEGGITRFLALFADGDEVEKIGPVRSARPYYLDWLSEYGDALYMHCGGSPDALKRIKEQKIFDANEFYWGDFYWREKNQTAPHNIYTRSENWKKIWENYGDEKDGQSWDGWKFGSDFSGGEKIKAVKIKYFPDYEVEWKYNETSEKFERFINGQEHWVSGGDFIQSDDVIIQYAQTEILDEEGRREIKNLAGGEARVLRNGEIIKGTWKKESTKTRTRFYNQNNEEIILTPGRIWVEVVPTELILEITK
ncbi:MAG: DUF3048 domain-containing protein [Patescibacteria group bacterium]|nr:DUF3048 domain-containing protein [Patescibacteria group bacterium]